MGSDHGFLHLVLLITSMLILSSSQGTGYRFNAGGKDGWVVKPSEDYSHWAQRNRFQVNDTIHFKYQKGSDSVVVVKREDYDSCNTNNPFHKMDDGDSTFKFDKSGPYFFISGSIENCKKGQKLIVVVMAVRHNKHSESPLPATPPPSVTHSPSAPPPSVTHSPAAPSPAKAESPKPSLDSPAPAPSSHSGSTRFSSSVGVVMAVSVGVVSFFSTFA
ncbi:early nodulin-like protein 3 [Gastrolobium bilobum]|uniref:early nodulin-like protein 3 n=1 Tax=Gastrolobium bilobum TaxID=150636 RepID=UPI002AAF6432|nr:early nodulin-like protein 3 [Gastrolobium bilobum]